ncbi:hypothetical protein [Stratiformator vulcanicus]|uniref:Uncharacterized protein n=1 Tax=Stratiformator vulcanicus TaxID=2527980 RepID=A0A517R159_9PLAN|nr:hypothetical protein [Stratiformator vulcanicus]QDT37629.1 hypothetical protein Pan189_20090 [Stratiformator vulcanicus]
MWCEDCQADVAAEYSPSDRILRCATCNASLESDRAGHGSSTDEARSLLERWSGESLLEPPEFGSKNPDAESQDAESDLGPAPENSHPAQDDHPAAEPHPPTAEVGRDEVEANEQAEAPHNTLRGPKFASRARRRSESGESQRVRRNLRTDAGHEDPESFEDSEFYEDETADVDHARSASYQNRRTVLHGPHTSRRDRGRRQIRIDEYEDVRSEAPHFDTSNLPATSVPTSNRWAVTLGQVLAYSGTLGLTCGAALVIWSYFGGPAGYAPTGWIVMTAGQMMLFLGVVTLISGGMEQTSSDVRTRVEMLGDRLIRIEQATNHALRGPHTGSKQRKRRRATANVRQERSNRPKYRLDEIE